MTQSVELASGDGQHYSGLPAPPLLPAQLKQLSPAALAYLGDAVYELHVRNFFLFPPRRQVEYHRLVVAWVRAEAQAQLLESLAEHLTSTELEIVRQGRNAATGGPKRLSAAIYQQATGLETLLGYLYISNPSRLADVFALLDFR